MITYTQGNLLDAPTEALVNTVNTVGVMGKGVALQFKHQYPEVYRAYKAAADRDELVIGKMQVVPLGNNKYVINFPTKQHWRNPSKLQWIKDGLADLCQQIKAYHIQSVAIPALGCGGGGLDWQVVKPVMEQYLSVLNIDVIIYEPAISAQQMVTSKKSSTPVSNKLSPDKVMLLELLYQHEGSGKTVTEQIALAFGYLLHRFVDTAFNFKFTVDSGRLSSNEVSYLLYTLNDIYLEGYGTTKLTLIAEKQLELNEYIAHQLTTEQQQKLKRLTEWLHPVKTETGLILLVQVDFLLQKHPATEIHIMQQQLPNYPLAHLQAAIKHLAGLSGM